MRRDEASRWPCVSPHRANGDVFLAPVRWRPFSCCTGSASPCACLTARLKYLGLEKPSQGPTLGLPTNGSLTALSTRETRGAGQHRDILPPEACPRVHPWGRCPPPFPSNPKSPP